MRILLVFAAIATCVALLSFIEAAAQPMVGYDGYHGEVTDFAVHASHRDYLTFWDHVDGNWKYE
jgi:hypothetical protein